MPWSDLQVSSGTEDGPQGGVPGGVAWHTQPQHMPESWKEASNQLSAINKAFIPTVYRSTGHSSVFKKKERKKRKKYLLALYIFLQVCCPVSTFIHCTWSPLDLKSFSKIRTTQKVLYTGPGSGCVFLKYKTGSVCLSELLLLSDWTSHALVLSRLAGFC